MNTWYVPHRAATGLNLDVYPICRAPGRDDVRQVVMSLLSSAHDRHTASLLAHHLKTLKLPTFLREYDKIAARPEGVDVRYLLRDLIDRERRMVERPSRRRLPRGQEPRQLRLQGHPLARRWLELARCEYIERRENLRARQQWDLARPTSPSVSAWRPARRASRSASSPPPRWSARPADKQAEVPKKLATYKLLIVDELGFVPLSKTGAELLFEVFSQRYERG